MSRMGRIFLTGLLAALPLLLTIFVTAWLLSVINQYLGPSSGFGRLLASLGFGVGTSDLASYLIGLGLIVGAIYALGLVVHSRLGPWLAALFDRLVRRIPLISNIYDLSSRFVSIVDTKNGDSLKSMSPAWCYFGGKPGAAVLALLPSKTPIRMGGEDYLGVLIPSAPVPFGGALVYVPAAWIEPAEGGIDELHERLRLDGHHAAWRQDSGTSVRVSLPCSARLPYGEPAARWFFLAARGSAARSRPRAAWHDRMGKLPRVPTLERQPDKSSVAAGRHGPAEGEEDDDPEHHRDEEERDAEGEDQAPDDRADDPEQKEPGEGGANGGRHHPFEDGAAGSRHERHHRQQTKHQRSGDAGPDAERQRTDDRGHQCIRSGEGAPAGQASYAGLGSGSGGGSSHRSKSPKAVGC